MEHFVIITGGGIGSRAGLDIPKQFFCLNGLPILMHTINQFAPFASTIIVTLPEQYFDYWEELQNKYEFQVPHILVVGGSTRFHSIKNALEYLPNEGLVAIHDAVRPFVSPSLIQLCFEQAQEYGTAVAATPLKDSLRIISDSKSKSVNRSAFYTVQTPQVFSCEIIKEAYQQPFKTSFTDDASVVEALGYDIQLVDGEESNFKITTPIDLTLAELLIYQNKS